MRIRHILVFAAAVVAALAPLSGQAGARTQMITITVQVLGAGKVTAPGLDCGLGATTCTTQIPGTSAIKFDAAPGDKSVFAAWMGDCSGTSPSCLLVIPDGLNVTVRAVFAYVEVINVKLGGTGEGTVVSNPAGINCGDDCARAFTADTSVTLTAIPKKGSLFAGWNGWCSGTSLTCTLKATGTAWALARFESTAKKPDSSGSGNQNSSSSTSGGLVFTNVGWGLENPSGTLYIAVKFRTSHEGTVWLKVKRGQKVYSSWHVGVRPGKVTVRLPMAAGVPKGAYKVYATLVSPAGKKSLTWNVRL